MRAQSHVVGVALMLSLTVLALGGITVAVGSVFDSHAANADAQRVAGQFEESLDPVGTTGIRDGRVTFGDGRVTTEARQLRVVRDGSVIEVVDVDALEFTAGDRRVSFVAGAIVRGRGSGAWLTQEPPIVTASDPDVLVVGAPALNESHATVAGGGSASLRTNVSHHRSDLGDGTFAVAIETESPAALERFFEEDSATTSRRDFDGDGVQSVVAEYPGTRSGYLVIHDMRLEVGDG